VAKRKEVPKKDAKKAIPPKSTRRRLHLPIYHLIAIGLIAGAALLAYSNTFSVPFHFDDRPNIIDNPNIQIKVFTWELEQWHEPQGKHSSLSTYRPELLRS
jgi:hypothetical protein